MFFDILTIFPDLLASPLQEGILRRAQEQELVTITVHNIRDHAVDKHKMTDDRPFGGAEGMVMKPEPLHACLDSIEDKGSSKRVILLSPRGEQFSQKKAEQLMAFDQLCLVCGRYEGVDERFTQLAVDEELSIGDFVLTGGELAAMVVVDTMARLVPGVLGCSGSVENDTFTSGLLKHGQYTRPREFRGIEVPPVLLSGDHAAIATYRFIESVRLTLSRRPDLVKTYVFSSQEKKILKKNNLFSQVKHIQDAC